MQSITVDMILQILPIAFVIALIAAFLFCRALKAQLNTVRPERNATQYRICDPVYSVCRDHHLWTRTERVPKNNSK